MLEAHDTTVLTEMPDVRLIGLAQQLAAPLHEQLGVDQRDDAALGVQEAVDLELAELELAPEHGEELRRTRVSAALLQPGHVGRVGPVLPLDVLGELGEDGGDVLTAERRVDIGNRLNVWMHAEPPAPSLTRTAGSPHRSIGL